MGLGLTLWPATISGASPRPSWRALALYAANAAILPAASLATYRPWIDGPWPAFGAAMGIALLAGLLVACCWTAAVRARAPAIAWLGLPLAVLVTAPAPAIHAARLLTRGTVVGGTLGAPVEYGRVAVPVLQGESSFSVVGDALSLRVPAGSTGFLALRWEPDAVSAWSLPRALIEPAAPQVPAPVPAPGQARVREEIAWRASVERDGAYFVLLEAGRISVQVTEFGLLVTAPDVRGDPKGDGIAVPQLNGRTVDWIMRRGEGRVRLLADGREVWTGPDAGALTPARLGETRTDRDHGGTLRVTGLRFGRWLASAGGDGTPAGAAPGERRAVAFR
jgi:hypothetical protein